MVANWRDLGPLLFLTVVAGCGGGEPDAPQAPEPVVLPELFVEAPERGSFKGTEEIRVSGVVTAGSAPLATLTVNGEEIGFDDAGRFDAVVVVTPGVDILSFRLVDEDGERAVDGRALHWGETFDEGVTLNEALFLHLGAAQLDDDDPDLDDAAGLIELVLADDAIVDAFVGTTSELEYFAVTPTAFAYVDAQVDIVPTDEALEVELRLSDVSMDFDIEGVGWYDWISTDGSAWMDDVTVALGLYVDVDGGQVDVDVATSSVSFGGFGLTVDYFPDLLEGALANWVQEDIEEGLEDTAVDMVQELLSEFLQEMAFSFDIGETSPQVHIDLELADIEVSDSGISIAMDGGVWGDAAFTMPAGAGSLNTSEPAPAWPMSGDLVRAQIDDDFANQLFFAIWRAGFLTDIVLSGPELAALTGAELEPPLGPAASIALSVELPPVVGTTVIEDRMGDVSLGELRMRIAREDGVVLDFAISARTAFSVDVQEDASFEASLDARPSFVEVAVGVLEYPIELDPGDLAALVKLMVPPLIGQAGAFVPDYNLPGVTLSDLMAFEGFEGLTLGLVDGELSMTEDGWLQIDGRLSAE